MVSPITEECDVRNVIRVIQPLAAACCLSLLAWTSAIASEGLCDLPPEDGCAENLYLVKHPFGDPINGSVGHCPDGAIFGCNFNPQPPGPVQIQCEPTAEDPLISRCELVPQGYDFSYKWTSTGEIVLVEPITEGIPVGGGGSQGSATPPFVAHVTCHRSGTGTLKAIVTAPNTLSASKELNLVCP
jgi:hypothetical protein